MVVSTELWLRTIWYRTYLERLDRGDDVSSVVDVIPSASQDMALQPIVFRSHHLISPL